MSDRMICWVMALLFLEGLYVGAVIANPPLMAKIIAGHDRFPLVHEHQ